MTETSVLVGPVTLNPSWSWCAGDLIDGLRQYFHVETFTGGGEFHAECEEIAKHESEILTIVKFPPNPKDILSYRGKIVYLPVDYFESPAHIDSHSEFLRRCNTILIHNERLRPYLSAYCNRIEFIEHYRKYALPEMNPYREEGFVVWVGFKEYEPLAIEWYNEKPRSFSLKIATNDIEMENNGIQRYNWNETIQKKLFEESKAGLDIKNDSFRHSTKPPTKIQQFVCSGIPAAINRSSYTWEYFHSKGFDLASPNDLDRWFSLSYWQETREVGLKLREEITRRNTIYNYVRILENLRETPSFHPFSRTGKFVHHDIPPTKETIEFVGRRVPQFEMNPSDEHVLAIQSCHRPKHDSLEATLNSLDQAGQCKWRGPKLIVTDGYFPSVPRSWILDVNPSSPVGSSKTFKRLLRSSLQISPNLSRLTYLQDDVSFSKNALTYIDRVKIDDDVSFITWFSFWKNWRGAGTDSLPVLELGQGASFYANLAITFPRRSVDLLLASLENERWEYRNASDRICATFLKDNLFAAHYPVIVQHTEGANSACTPLCTNERKSNEFAGEDFDTLTLCRP